MIFIRIFHPEINQNDFFPLAHDCASYGPFMFEALERS